VLPNATQRNPIFNHRRYLCGLEMANTPAFGRRVAHNRRPRSLLDSGFTKAWVFQCLSPFFRGLSFRKGNSPPAKRVS